ncbi:MAG TPA: hypothetical protein VK063_01155 [Beutenbergiaceae bacterium]|nr:hypothetical protein [Beutenbergiaceae bacterium]
MFLEFPQMAHISGLTREINEGVSARAATASEFANEQNSTRWTINSEAYRFARSYRDRLLDMQDKMNRITEKVEQFSQGLTDSGMSVENLDDEVTSHLEALRSKCDHGNDHTSPETVR